MPKKILGRAIVGKNHAKAKENARKKRTKK